ncbi:polysaccharide deacetylase family protein [Sphingomonadaceae bacterium LXI357]|uniref:Polysaccharide deacetylase family protein n=2 Tax=Stakelama marina TaxID=2826939 RepID=A0A8T4IBF2_9SPHN|nr:polysaccharide deacetylase family protein [Stakelama marina]
MPPNLLVSIHDVGPSSEGATDRLRDILEPATGEYRYAMLVVPNHWGRAPIVAGSPFASRLRDWSDRGVEIFLHGCYHRDDTSHDSAAARWKAKRMTAGEGEFLGLDYQTAFNRMRDGRDMLQDIIGKPVAGFIAPAWLYGPDALAAMADCGFALAEDHFRVWKPSDGTIVARGPVITWASRTRMRQASSLAVAAAARALMPARRGMRLAVHPGDVTVPRLVDSIAKTVRALANRAPIGRYADLLGTPTVSNAVPEINRNRLSSTETSN